MCCSLTAEYKAEARVVLEAYEARGLSQAEFARRHGLRARRLKWLRSKLGSEAKVLSFVPVQVVPALSAQVP